jgi:hypothetical protein
MPMNLKIWRHSLRVVMIFRGIGHIGKCGREGDKQICSLKFKKKMSQLKYAYF